jgi:Xaa-Pro aminopeptidase
MPCAHIWAMPCACTARRICARAEGHGGQACCGRSRTFGPAIFGALKDGGASIVELRDPTMLPKAQKNPVEQAGHRAAQARDGAALSGFLHWLRSNRASGRAHRTVAGRQAAGFSRATGQLRDLSFDTISAAGPNARIALPGRRGIEPRIEPNSIYLVDSGGQYLDGTTDVTRTVWVGPGEPTA